MGLISFIMNIKRDKRVRQIANTAGFDIHENHCPQGCYIAKGGWHQQAAKASQPFDSLDALKRRLEDARLHSLDTLTVYDMQARVYYLAIHSPGRYCKYKQYR